MNLAVVVQHHPSRAHLLPRLAELGEYEIVVDPEPTAPRASAIRTYVECLRSMPADATHLLIVQDDVVPARDFRARAEAAIPEKADDLVALFVPGRQLLRRMMGKAYASGKPWLLWPNYNYVPTVATVWPRAHALAFLDFAEGVIAERRGRGWDTHGDDPYTGQWAKRSKIPVWCTVPCLIEHPDDEPSLFRPAMKPRAGSNRARIAALFVDD